MTKARQVKNEMASAVVDMSDQPEIKRPIEVSRPMEPRAYTPKPCSVCVAIRPTGQSFTVVYATRGVARYCRCRYCGSTWKEVGQS